MNLIGRIFLCFLTILQSLLALVASSNSKTRHYGSQNDLLLNDGAKQSTVPESIRGPDSPNFPLFYENTRREPPLKLYEKRCSLPLDFKCYDGTCLESYRTCDGKVDCPDGSDETLHLCGNMKCFSYQFQCAYGPCVHGLAACNGITDCADNSDELHISCRNRLGGNTFRCDSGDLLDLYMRCDGLINCRDGSDETLRACADVQCPPRMFKCAYGACVSEWAMCNGINDCADGSDESALLCARRIPRTIPPTSPITTTVATPPVCVMPDHLEHGRFHVNGLKRIIPGMVKDILYFNVTCDPGYILVGIPESNPVVMCFYGKWTVFPKCVAACKLEASPKIDYRCVITELKGADGTRDCKTLEPEGTLVQPKCREPEYYSPYELPYMNCTDGGEWSYTPTCLSECGLVSTEEEPLIIGGYSVRRGEVPWEVNVYRKDRDGEQPICGGVIITEDTFATAGHCVHDDVYGPLPASLYTVAAGKLYPELNNPKDYKYAQISDVKHINPSLYFKGRGSDYRFDLAVGVVEKPFVFNAYVRRVCLDFGHDFISRLLQRGNLGQVAGHGLTTGHVGSESDTLQALYMPYLTYEDAKILTPEAFKKFVTRDKIYAGSLNGTAPSKGDSGGGYTMPVEVRGKTRHYLLGVISTSFLSLDGKQSNPNAPTGIEPIANHKKLIKHHWFP